MLLTRRTLHRHNVCEITGGTPRTPQVLIRNGVDIYPCFAHAFHYMNEKPGAKTFIMQYKLHIKKAFDSYANNFAILQKKDMCRYLNAIKQYIPFKYHFEDLGEEYLVVLNITGTAYQNKALLMLSRGLFEFPHNLCVYDAIKMRDSHDLPEEQRKMSLFHLYLLCLTSQSEFSIDESIINGHCIKPLSGRDFREALKEPSKRNISHIFGTSITYRPERRGFSLYSETYLSDASYQSRRDLYLRNLNGFIHA